jgi:hypothetical protein
MRGIDFLGERLMVDGLMVNFLHFLFIILHFPNHFFFGYYFVNFNSTLSGLPEQGNYFIPNPRVVPGANTL